LRVARPMPAGEPHRLMTP